MKPEKKVIAKISSAADIHSQFQTVRRINEEVGYSDGDFIFCDEEGRTKIREVDNCIRVQCIRAGIDI